MTRHSDFHLRLRPVGDGYTAELRQITGPCDLIYLPAGAHSSGAATNPAAAMLSAIVAAKLGRPVQLTQACVRCDEPTSSAVDRLCDPCLDSIGRTSRVPRASG